MDDVSRVVEEASRIGPVLGVVNNAGIGSPPRPFREIPVEDWREMLEVHVIGAVHCVLATLDKMDEMGFGRYPKRFLLLRRSWVRRIHPLLRCQGRPDRLHDVARP